MLKLQNIEHAVSKLDRYDTTIFKNSTDSFVHFINKIEIVEFRNIKNLFLSFDHPITVITGTNKIGKTSILLLLACSHKNFMKYDSTKPGTIFRRHTWRDVLSFTRYENTTREYSYKLYWRVGNEIRNGVAKRKPTSQAWTGVGKASSDPIRKNAQIRDKDVRLIDLERILPARNFSNSLMKKITRTTRTRLNPEIEQAFSYIFETPNVEIFSIGAHINKQAFLINYENSLYSSYNAASGEEALLNILIDVIETPHNSLILIDEIEAGFHPYVQRKLADIIKYISWIHKKQFILTTHSPTLLSAFSQKSRKFIDINKNSDYEVISKISVNAAFSKMDSKAYPLLSLYCEDEISEFILSKLILKINESIKFFNRLVNIIKSGPANQVKNDYVRHKKNYSQMRYKVGYCSVFDGDLKNDPEFSNYYNNPTEFSFFLYPYTAPEKFLVKSYLDVKPNQSLQTSLNLADHHALFQEMVQLGISADISDSLKICWSVFEKTSEYLKLLSDFQEFILKVAKYFSEINE